MWPCIVVNFLQQNQLDALISQIYSWNETLHVSDSSSVHHQELFTVHTAMAYVIQVCWQLASRIRMCHLDHARKLSAKVFDILVYHCCVYSEKLLMMDRGTVPKHIEFHSKNKFEKLVRLAGFIVRKHVMLYQSAQLCDRKTFIIAALWQSYCIVTTHVSKSNFLNKHINYFNVSSALFYLWTWIAYIYNV